MHKMEGDRRRRSLTLYASGPVTIDGRPAGTVDRVIVVDELADAVVVSIGEPGGDALVRSLPRLPEIAELCEALMGIGQVLADTGAGSTT